MNIPRIPNEIDRRIHLFQSTESISKWYQKYGDKQNLLLRLLYLAGVLVESGSLYCQLTLILAFQGFSFLLNVGTLFTAYYNAIESYGSSLFVLEWLHLICSVATTLLWWEMRKRRKILSAFLHTLPDVTYFARTKTQRMFFFSISVVPFISAVFEALISTGRRVAVPYIFINNRSVSFIVLFITEIFTALLYPTCMNWTVLLYCLLCKRMCKSIRDLTAEIENCPPKDFALSKQAAVLRRESEIHDSVLLLQKAFSAPILLVCTSHFFASIAILSQIIVSFNSSVISLCQFSLYYINATGGILALLWVAGELPIEAERFEEAFRRKARKGFLLNFRPDEICIEQKLIKASKFVLSGEGIVHFRRSSILALCGTILTYFTLLICRYQV